MIKQISVAVMTTVLMLPSPVHAGAGDLSTCLIDSLNRKERKQLAQWIYFAIAAHPEMKAFSNVSEDERLSTDKIIGQLVSRLLVND